MRIFQFLQDEKGMFSSTRLVFLIWSIGMLACWIIISIGQQKFADIPDNAMWILLSLMTGKAVQKFGESKQEKPIPTNTAPPAKAGTGSV